MNLNESDDTPALFAKNPRSSNEVRDAYPFIANGAYGKDRYMQDFLNTSRMLYADSKKAYA